MVRVDAKYYQKGQAALIALLVLTVATTVGLSLIARGTTDISVNRDIEESSRAFSAAEAGVEEALRSGVASSSSLDQLALQYNVTVASVSASPTNPFIFPKKTVSENTETVWLVDHNTDGTIIETPTYTANSIDICWSSEPTVPALLVTLLYKESTDISGNPYRVVKGAYDPNSARATLNSFSAPTALSGGCAAGNTTYRQTMTFSSLNATIDAADTLIALRIRPVYSGTQLVVRPAQDLAYQGNRIESVGQTPSGVNRKIVVYQQYKSPSGIFDAAIFSEGSFVHQ
jgi:Tfp pilus assembly protein PilX